MKKNRLSVAIATYNEEKNLGFCLETVKDWVEEIVIVDGSSTDKTVEIAKKYGANITVTDNPPIFHINKQKAVEKCRGDWILQLDADERVTSQLREEIEKAISDLPSKVVGYYLPRKNYFLGQWMKRGGQYPDPVIRLFKKGFGRFPCENVHEQISINGKVVYFKNELLHYPFPDFSEYLVKANRYSTLLAKEYEKKKIGRGFFHFCWYFFLIPATNFFVIYFRHRGFSDGFPGFVFALFSAFQKKIAYIKYRELTRETNINQ